MTDLTNGVDARNGRSNITQMGIVVINTKEDHREIDSRAGITTQYSHHGRAHYVYPKELVFTRKDKLAVRANDSASIQSDVEVFSNLAGITETAAARDATEKNYVLVGISRNRPMHQDMEGRDRGGRFATQIGGLVTIRCESARAIPVMTPIMWRAPRLQPGESNDPRKVGRALAQIVPYDPVESSASSLNVHNSVRRIMEQNDGLVDDESGQARCEQADACLFESLLAIVYTGIVAYSEHNGTISDSKKLQLAEDIGLVMPKSGTNHSAKRFQQNLADRIFSADFDPVSKSSQKKSQGAFELMPAGAMNSEDQRKQQIARKQAVQFDTLAKSLAVKERATRDRIFGVTMSSGKPGGDIDVLITRM